MKNLSKAIRHLKEGDPVMAAIIERVGTLKLRQAEPTFESLARAIVYQQLNGKAATAIYMRVVAASGGKLTPESVLQVSDEQLRACGLSRAKLAYIRDLASRTANGEVKFESLPDMTDEEVIEHLTRVKGIGIWSAQMFLMSALNRPNVMPTGDFGIRSAIAKAYRKRKHPTHKEMMKMARRWEPYCSIACYYLWRSIDPESDD